MEEQEGRGLSSPWGKRAERGGEGSSRRCCPNVEDPSKTNSSDASYRTENQEVRARAERRREEMTERQRAREEAGVSMEVLTPLTLSTYNDQDLGGQTTRSSGSTSHHKVAAELHSPLL